MSETKTNIRILVCYHKPARLLRDEILTPIHVGRALAQKRMDPKSEEYRWLTENMIGDDTGENISEKNASYNEMTALYWAWKNYEALGDPDYIGLMHYRRHFVLHEGETGEIPFEDMGEHYLEETGYSPEALRRLVEGCDFVAHLGKVKNVYRHYAENHRKEDLDLALEILDERNPEYRESARRYLAGDVSCFCNMFIFRRELFFDYCRWIFGILEEFEKRRDLSEKRLFISERLMGIYIARLMENRDLTYKVLPISCVTEPAEVPLVLPLEEGNQFSLAVTLTSLLENKKPQTRYAISLLTGKGTDEKVRRRFAYFPEKYGNCSLEVLETDLGREYYPLAAAWLLPQAKKCIYLEENALALRDLGEFYRTCSVDDFWGVGAPLGKYDPMEPDKRLDPAFLVLNCARLREHQVRVQAGTGEGESGQALFNRLFEGQTGYVPWYYMTLADERGRGAGEAEETGILFGIDKPRRASQEEALWKPILFYGRDLPWEDPQGVYSVFWWDLAARVPGIFPFVPCDLHRLEEKLARDQREIDRAMQEAREIPQEDWRSYSLLGKLRFYYRHNGLKQTLRYGLRKLTGGRFCEGA